MFDPEICSLLTLRWVFLCSFARYGDGDEQYKKLADTSRFKPDKGFRGAESSEGQSRDAPVQFERDEDPTP